MRCPKPRIAYCSQQPWIRNESLRENVLFGEAMDMESWINWCQFRRKQGKKQLVGSAEGASSGVFRYMFYTCSYVFHHFPIIFPMDFPDVRRAQDWYTQVLDACGLAMDLQQLSHGDLTEIGERGITLSGGRRWINGSTDLGWIRRNGCRELISVSSWFVCTPPSNNSCTLI